ncbi:MAG: outer membrane protein assembly factor BamD, partial [Verrucomicrobiaceae bacterium]|nr:outer membrane protein assembly factor BamD [Verrucomicrobiaceae bacterium]
APFGRFAPLAQFAIAEIHQDQGEKNEAVAAYQSIVDNYPASKEAAEAQFRIGAISNIASKATADSSNLTASRDALQTYITTNPSGDRAMEAKTMLTQIDTDEARRSLDIGKFYEKTGKPKAAAIYYNEALKFGSPEVSEEARTRLSQVSGADPDAVVDAKMNNPGNDYTAPAAVDLRSRADYAGPPAPELARLSAKPKMRKDDASFAPLPINEPKLPTVGDPAAAPAAGSLLPPVAGDKPALLPVPPPPPGIPPQPEAPKAEEKKGN